MIERTLGFYVGSQNADKVTARIGDAGCGPYLSVRFPSNVDGEQVEILVSLTQETCDDLAKRLRELGF